jgi:hypothetical protein
MIDINKLNELEKEVRDIKDTILKQVWLVHHIVGVDFNSDNDALIEIDEVYEQRGDYTELPYIVIKSHDFIHEFGDVYKLYQSCVYIKKELFDMTEEELRANKERLSNELEETNKIQRNARLNTMIAYDSMCRLRKNGECNK